MINNKILNNVHEAYEGGSGLLLLLLLLLFFLLLLLLLFIFVGFDCMFVCFQV